MYIVQSHKVCFLLASLVSSRDPLLESDTFHDTKRRLEVVECNSHHLPLLFRHLVGVLGNELVDRLLAFRTWHLFYISLELTD